MKTFHTYKYIVNRFEYGHDDAELENAIVDITVTWDDTSIPRSILPWNINALTSYPNVYKDSEEGLVEEVCVIHFGSLIECY